MKLHYGATYNLNELIKTHLFIICATNSGTTFLKQALSTSEKTWNLTREGQHTYGFAGPSGIGTKASKLWATRKYWIDIFTNPQNYDWDKIKTIWYFQAHAQNANAPIFVEKSPPFLLIVEQLFQNFKNPKFLFMVRNPYAVTEGIHRKTYYKKFRHTVTEKEFLDMSAIQVINCLNIQKQNIENWSKYGTFFTYEQMCEEPEKVQHRIKKLVPEIDDLALRQKLKVKNYNEELRNMNDQQIERLTNENLEQINKIFSPHKDVLDYFGYSLL